MVRQVSPALSQNFEKSALILRKNALIAVICGLNFSFKVQFLRVSKRKNQRFFPCFLFSCRRWLFTEVP